MPSPLFEKGMKLRRQVLGDAHVDRSWAEHKDDPLTGPLQELITEMGWGAVWARGGLELKTRSAINVAMLTALNRPHELEVHVRGALRNGITVDELREILVQTAAYCGWPAAIDAFRVARRVVAEHLGNGAAPAAAKKAPAKKKPAAAARRKTTR
jgi:4-carboxymuconolactone decarboxylase